MKESNLNRLLLFGPFEMANLHTHSGFEINFLESGNAIYYTDAKEYRLCKNELLVLNAAVPHRLVMLENSKLHSLECAAHYFPRDIALSPENIITYTLNNFLCELVHDIISSAGTDVCDAHIRSAISYLLSYCSVRGSESYLQKAVDYIENHYQEIEALQDVAAQIHMSASHLQRKFKKDKGIAIGTFINSVRMKQAAYLLENTDLPIGNMDEYVGIHSRQTFYKMFRRTYKMSPYEYRNSNTNRICLNSSPETTLYTP